MNTVEERVAFLRSAAATAYRVADALEGVEAITCAWEDVVLATQAIQAVATDPEHAGVSDTLVWAAEALQSFAAQSLDVVLNPHNDEEELAKRFAADPEMLLRVWMRVGKLRIPRHPLELK